MTSYISRASILFLATVALIYISSANADISDTFKVKSSTPVCVGKICDDSNILYYFECCGSLATDCCVRLQTWVIVVLVVLGILMLASFIIGLVRCICCCDR